MGEPSDSAAMAAPEERLKGAPPGCAPRLIFSTAARPLLPARVSVGSIASASMCPRARAFDDSALNLALVLRAVSMVRCLGRSRACCRAAQPFHVLQRRVLQYLVQYPVVRHCYCHAIIVVLHRSRACDLPARRLAFGVDLGPGVSQDHLRPHIYIYIYIYI